MTPRGPRRPHRAGAGARCRLHAAGSASRGPGSLALLRRDAGLTLLSGFVFFSSFRFVFLPG